MLRKLLVLVLVTAVMVSIMPAGQRSIASAQDDTITIAFVPGVNPDPFYVTMSAGVMQAAVDLGVEVIQQDPDEFNPTVQTPIIEALVARGDVDFLITAPTDSQQMIPVLQSVNDAGIPLLTVDTFIGDGNYADGEVTFPISYIGSDNFQGGYIACSTLADKLGEGAKIYIQNVRPGISTTDQREDGCEAAAADRGLEVVAVDYNENDVNTAQQQTQAVLEANPDITGVFGANTFSAQGAGAAVQNAGLGGAVEVVAFDASEFAIELLRDGTVTQVIAQIPYDMGYMAVALAVAYLKGYQSIPARIPTGYAVMNADNVDDPEISKYIYTETEREPQPRLEDFNVAFVPGVNPDPFYITMSYGAQEAAAQYGVNLIQQDPEEFNPTVQTPIIEALVARGDIDFMFTAPTDSQQMIPVLQNVVDAGIPLLTVDTFIGDGNYADGEVTFPITYIGSDNTQGGEIACNTLADLLGEGAKIYIQNVRPGISTTDQREQGCEDAAAARGLEVVAVDYNENDVNTAQQQTQAILEANPDVVGVFGANTFSAQGAGAAVQNAGLGGAVEVVAFDASAFAIELLRDGTVTQVIAQKPGDMGYFAVLVAVADARGVVSVPARWQTGYAVINAENVDDPEISRFIYKEE
ncbi:MAG: substrate-binding domain-containing protein [Anaerolineae bacterium]|nr:substrate-binding domain-containing protein [Anaerolineae bacterium]